MEHTLESKVVLELMPESMAVKVQLQVSGPETVITPVFKAV